MLNYKWLRGFLLIFMVLSLLAFAKAQNRERVVPSHMINLNQYNTQLTQVEEYKFNVWAIDRCGSSERVKSEMGAYDLKGAWKELEEHHTMIPKGGHLPDTYKKPNHITFSTESIYAEGRSDAGVWRIEKDGRWSYMPSNYTISLYGKEMIRQYFLREESDAILRFE